VLPLVWFVFLFFYILPEGSTLGQVDDTLPGVSTVPMGELGRTMTSRYWPASFPYPALTLYLKLVRLCYFLHYYFFCLSYIICPCLKNKYPVPLVFGVWKWMTLRLQIFIRQQGEVSWGGVAFSFRNLSLIIARPWHLLDGGPWM